MKRLAFAASAVVALCACNDAIPTAPVTLQPTPGDCGGSTVFVEQPAPKLVLATDEAPSGLHQISAQPVSLASLPTAESSANNSYEVVYANTANTHRVVSEAVVADTPGDARLLYEGTLTELGKQGAKDVSPITLCDEATAATVTSSGKLVYVVTWHHGNVFAEVVVRNATANDEQAQVELRELATYVDQHITDQAQAPAST